MSKFCLPRVAIIDYEMGNLFSVKRACEYVGLKADITSSKEDILGADAAILPGVGAFGDAISVLNRLDLIKPMLDFIKSGRPFMGICLGMQLLMSESEEFGRHNGLNIIEGEVVKFTTRNESRKSNKVPQVGWNRIKKVACASASCWDNTPLSGIEDGEFMYFVHSYYCRPTDNTVTLSVTEYGGIEYCSSFLSKNIFASQFHPEKSASEGLKIYKNWSLRIK